MMLFRWSYTLEYAPFNWRQVRVIFIPQSGRKDLEQPKAFRLISLMSVILKSMERLVAAHIRSTDLVDQITPFIRLNTPTVLVDLLHLHFPKL